MRNLKYIYALVFASLAGWLIFAYITTTDIIKNQQSYASIINITGKQRMLSQKIALMANRYYDSRDIEHKAHLISLNKQMQLEHAYIIKTHINSAATKSVYFSESKQLNAKVKQYFNIVNTFIAKEDLAALHMIESFSFSLLPLLDDAVNVLKKKVTKRPIYYLVVNFIFWLE